MSVEGDRRKLVIAAALLDTIASKVGKEFTLAGVRTGRQLLGLRYRPPFDYFYSKFGAVAHSFYRPKEGEQWADYPLLYALNVATSSSRCCEEEALGGHRPDETKRGEDWLRQNPTRPVGWHIVPGDFVTTDTGTGIVHLAPAFGEVDLEVLKREQRLFGPNEDVPPLLCPVAPDGTFTDEVPDYAGRWVKETDRDIIRRMKAERHPVLRGAVRP